MIRLVDGTPKVIKQSTSCVIWTADMAFNYIEDNLSKATGEVADILVRMQDFILRHLDLTYFYNKNSTSYEDVLLIHTDATVLYSTKGLDPAYLVYEEVRLRHFITLHCVTLWGTPVVAIDTTVGQYTLEMRKDPEAYRMYRCDMCGRIMFNLRGQDAWAKAHGLKPLTVCAMCTDNAKNLKNVVKVGA